MSKLKVVQWPVEKLIPYARNPRKNDAQVDRMVSAIKEFGFRIPVVAQSDGTVIDGHLRLKAAQKLGLKEVPVALADELTDAQVKAFRLLANKSANWAEWDNDLLKLELEELHALDFDLDLTGFDPGELGDIWLGEVPLPSDTDDIDTSEDKYSTVVKTPIYEPTGDPVELAKCYDDGKYKKLLQEIEAADVEEDIRHFLMLAASRHIVFNYEKIANLYANASKELQTLMENSALVIIDYDKALENGFIELQKKFEQFKETGGDCYDED